MGQRVGGHQGRNGETGEVVVVRGLLRGSLHGPESVEVGLVLEVWERGAVVLLFGGPSSTSAHSAGVEAQEGRGAD